MDLLAGYSSGSDSAEESSSDSDEAVPAKAPADKKAPAAKAQKNMLPSVDDLFATTKGASFLATANPKDDFTVAPLKKQKVEKDLPTPQMQAAAVAASAGAAAQRAAPASAASAKQLKPGDNAEPSKERLNRKDKVKQQRLAGQVRGKQLTVSLPVVRIRAVHLHARCVCLRLISHAHCCC